MSAHTHNEAHSASAGKYMVGFILSVILTLASFLPVMNHWLDDWAVSSKVIYLVGMALIQIVVQIIFFLHLNEGPDAKWNVTAMWSGVVFIALVIGGTWFAISHLNYNMMGGSGRVIRPSITEQLPNDNAPAVQIKTPNNVTE
ncbi:cytochrome o ubiquinol oxidase subunit IV [Bartonella tamiae]|uniref:Cytochrome bo(3) ubiquinol oxidase subunit 4 n=1 Tax=Bartonella tamiae Th239 TaxID=1094558 RepID=J0R6A5_9HYPH|nr:cytochrome o ubiquinol oxidase subunit IV [Bartonella tamiae]EJF91244.1 cytochrome o ubiquinol oxidase subunit IV [Bartonella tamiae Th239]EJF93091.1 cytochrome o ubiquinol oxidase subunit IV [Bartonella tamiae Th307]